MGKRKIPINYINNQLRFIISASLFVFSINVYSHGFIPLPAEGVALAEWKMFHGDISPDISTYPSIKNDLAALSDRKLAKNAAARLKWRGDEILEEAHIYLKDTSNPVNARYSVSLILTSARNPKSIDTIIAYIDSLEKVNRIYSLQRSLSRFGSNQKVINYFSEILNNDDSSERYVVAAFNYFATIEYQSAETWIDKYNNDKQSDMTRKAALYLAARLGKRQYKDDLISLLLLKKEKFPRGGERAELNLLYGLVHITSKEEFIAVAASSYIGTKYKDDVNKYLLLHKGSVEEKRQIVKDALFKYRTRKKLRNVVDYLVRMDEPEPLVPYWNIGHPAIHELLEENNVAIKFNGEKPAFVASKDYDYKRNYPTLEMIAVGIEKAIKSGKSMQDNSMRILSLDEYNQISLIAKGAPSKEGFDIKHAAYEKKMSTSMFKSDSIQNKDVKANIKESLIGRDRLQISSIEIKVKDEKVTQRIVVTSVFFDGEWIIYSIGNIVTLKGGT